MSPHDIELKLANDFDYVQKVNRAVADALFPKRTVASMLLKMYSEVGEIVDAPDDPEEIADVIIMLLDRMDQIGAHAGEEILKKLRKNLERSWQHNEKTGVWNHG